MTRRDPDGRSGPVDETVEDLIDDLETLEDAVDSGENQRVIRRTIRALGGYSRRRIFGLDDVAQQIVGGFVLSAPFVVTEEVWSLAAGMNALQWAVTVVMVLTIGYGALYRADDDRDADREESIAGLPQRFVSLVLIAYLSVTILAFVLSAPATFGADAATTARAICVGAVFSVVGAATADSLFG